MEANLRAYDHNGNSAREFAVMRPDFDQFAEQAAARSVTQNSAFSIESSSIAEGEDEMAPLSKGLAPEYDVSALQEQLGPIIDQIKTLHQPSAETVNALRNEFQRMKHALNKALPQHAIGRIGWQVQKLSQDVAESGQIESAEAALMRIETGLTDLRSALHDLTQPYFKQLGDEITELRMMVADVASHEAIKSLAAQLDDLSNKIDRFQQIYVSHVADAHQASPAHNEDITANANNEMLTPSINGSGARFIAAARRAAQTSAREANAETSFIEPNAHPNNSIKISSPYRRLMAGFKLLFVSAGIAAAVVCSAELTDNAVIRSLMMQLFQYAVAPATSDMIVEPDNSEALADADTNQSTLAEDSTPATIQDVSKGVTQDMPHEPATALPVSGNLFGISALSNASALIHSTPLMFGPSVSAPAPKIKSEVSSSVAPTSADAQTPAQSLAYAATENEELPAVIGGERLRKAAVSGDAAAAYTVAQRYAEGRGVPINLEEAARWYERAASKGLVPAQFRYATMLEKGQGLKKDIGQARHLYLAAAAKGDAKSMHNLAVLYANGIDGKPDYANAVAWFRKAANHGIVDSQYNLAVLTERGLGTETNLAEAYKWFALAAVHGDHEAGRKRDELAAQLDAEQFAAAEAAVKVFAAKPQPKEALLVPTPAGGWDNASNTPLAEHERPPSPSPPMSLDAFKIGAR
jgi:predicted  nucleic acid-binding Zn-ribbon protein